MEKRKYKIKEKNIIKLNKFYDDLDKETKNKYGKRDIR